jgi:hypothetical protein
LAFGNGASIQVLLDPDEDIWGWEPVAISGRSQADIEKLRIIRIIHFSIFIWGLLRSSYGIPKYFVSIKISLRKRLLSKNLPELFCTRSNKMRGFQSATCNVLPNV